MNNKLFVGGLSFETTQGDLRQAFAPHGTVEDAVVINDRVTGRSKGFGFVTMSSDQEAQKALEAMNGQLLGGRNLTVNVARPREEGGRSGGDRRDRGDNRGGRERGRY